MYANNYGFLPSAEAKRVAIGAVKMGFPELLSRLCSFRLSISGQRMGSTTTFLSKSILIR